jgi:smad nuclear-interacting protein 1
MRHSNLVQHHVCNHRCSKFSVTITLPAANCYLLLSTAVYAAEEWAADEPPPPGPPKQGPNLGLSGKLAAETNKTADGTAELKFQAPAEARVCKKPVWKLFTYKGSEQLGEPINLTQLPFYLFGKDRKVADIPTDHPSCSRQHAVLVFR